VKRPSSQSGYFYRSVSATEQDNDDPTNLGLHLDQQLRNPTARVYRVRYLGEYLGDVRCIRHPRSMVRLQTLFREHHLEGLLLEMHENYQDNTQYFE